ncbi:hypothetical protein HPB49_014397 [Dermacentor silvarum]|uniref:Uncharacterized protein n=1 Tax=Dermacentor silvarum TaxID=543639 RepID=A0ACB8C9Y9_DERSI|nr:hypothetical protein HPB49_014397 [Dermacentor silvarum]
MADAGAAKSAELTNLVEDEDAVVVVEEAQTSGEMEDSAVSKTVRWQKKNFTPPLNIAFSGEETITQEEGDALTPFNYFSSYVPQSKIRPMVEKLHVTFSSFSDPETCQAVDEQMTPFKGGHPLKIYTVKKPRKLATRSGAELKFHKQLRNRWIAAVRRVNHDGKPWKPSKNARICSNHFYKGEPSRVPSDPDYVPSIFTYRPARSGVLPRQQRASRRQGAAKAVPNSAESVPLHAAKAAEALIDIPVVCQANALQKDLEQTRTALAESQKLAHYWKERYESSRERFLSVNLIWQPNAMPMAPDLNPQTCALKTPRRDMALTRRFTQRSWAFRALRRKVVLPFLPCSDGGLSLRRRIGGAAKDNAS